MEIVPEQKEPETNADESEDMMYNGEDGQVDSNRVNLSNTGLTMVPVTLFTRFEVTHLDLSENNLKNLPTDISQMQNLQCLNLSKNGFSCTSSEDFTVLPRQMKKLCFLRSLNISECNLQFIPSTIWEIISLERLDISQNNIGTLKPNVGNLNNLQWLNVQRTGITTLPQEIIGCERLETLLLYGNTIQTFPSLLASIPYLHYIFVNLRHFTKSIDSNMDSLLQTGQIVSNHIPGIIFNLPSIKRIELEFCKINNFKELQSKIVEELYLRGNFFNEISTTILNLDKLTVLDLSNNFLVDVTEDIIKLKHLKSLLLQQNQLISLSDKVFTITSLEILDLSYNKLTEISFPSNGCDSSLKTLKINNNKIRKLSNKIINLENLEDLDVTSNHITKIPSKTSMLKNMTMLHTYKGLYKVGLWLLNNPIEFPPKNVWHTKNIERIYEYLRKTKIEKLQRKVPIRIILLGDDNNQKLKFLNQFLNKTDSKSEDFITIDQWMSSNSVPFVLVNINCNPVYSMLWGKFIDNNSLIWLFINKHENDQLKYIEKWLKLIIEFSRDCVIQIIITNENIPSCNSDSNDPQLELDEDKNNGSNDDLRNLIEFLQTKYQQDRVKILSCYVELFIEKSLIPFKESLEIVGIDATLFHVERNYGNEKDLYVIEKICKSFSCIYWTKDELISQIKEVTSLTTTEIDHSLKMLHKKGKLLWFFRYKKLAEKVYPFITVFNKSIYSLLRVNYDDVLNYITNLLIRAEGCIDEETFLDIERNFKYKGEICYPFYKILSIEVGKSKELKNFLIDAELAWTAPISDSHEENIFKRPYLVFPYYNREEFEITYFLEEVLLKEENVSTDCVISISSECVTSGCDLFVNISSAVNIWAIRRFDWKDVIYLVHNDGDVTLFKEFSEDSQLKIGVIVRRWAENWLHLLPFNGNFRKWIEDWYVVESENRNRFSFQITENNFEEFDEYFSNHLVKSHN